MSRRMQPGQRLRGKAGYDKAIADYKEAIRLNPQNALAYYHRGLARQHREVNRNGGVVGHIRDKNDGEIEKAEADYLEAIRLKPDFVSAYNDLGNLHGCRATLRKHWLISIRPSKLA